MFSPPENLDQTPAAAPPPAAEENQKRNSGRTGPTTAAGRAASSRNAIKHGLCAKTLILPNESHDDWLELLALWQDNYPSDNPLLATFILKTAQAEWHRIRVQQQYDEFLSGVDGQALHLWTSDQKKDHELLLRYLTSVERKFQREFRLLEQFYKTYGKPAASQEEEEEEETPVRGIVIIRRHSTGEAYGPNGEVYPPPPGYVPKPIIPGADPHHRLPPDFKNHAKHKKR